MNENKFSKLEQLVKKAAVKPRFSFYFKLTCRIYFRLLVKTLISFFTPAWKPAMALATLVIFLSAVFYNDYRSSYAYDIKIAKTNLQELEDLIQGKHIQGVGIIPLAFAQGAEGIDLKIEELTANVLFHTEEAMEKANGLKSGKEINKALLAIDDLNEKEIMVFGQAAEIITSDSTSEKMGIALEITAANLIAVKSTFADIQPVLLAKENKNNPIKIKLEPQGKKIKRIKQPAEMKTPSIPPVAFIPNQDNLPEITAAEKIALIKDKAENSLAEAIINQEKNPATDKLSGRYLKARKLMAENKEVQAYTLLSSVDIETKILSGNLKPLKEEINTLPAISNSQIAKEEEKREVALKKPVQELKIEKEDLSSIITVREPNIIETIDSAETPPNENNSNIEEILKEEEENIGTNDIKEDLPPASIEERSSIIENGGIKENFIAENTETESLLNEDEGEAEEEESQAEETISAPAPANTENVKKIFLDEGKFIIKPETPAILPAKNRKSTPADKKSDGLRIIINPNPTPAPSPNPILLQPEKPIIPVTPPVINIRLPKRTPPQKIINTDPIIAPSLPIAPTTEESKDIFIENKEMEKEIIIPSNSSSPIDNISAPSLNYSLKENIDEPIRDNSPAIRMPIEENPGINDQDFTSIISNPGADKINQPVNLNDNLKDDILSTEAETELPNANLKLKIIIPPGGNSNLKETIDRGLKR